MKYLALIAMLFLTRPSFSQDGWSEKENTYILDQLAYAADKIMMSTDQKSLFVKCGTEKYKTLYPNGIKSMTMDQLNAASRKVSDACLQELKPAKFGGWNPEIENKIKQSYAATKEMQMIDSSYRSILIDCIVEKFKIKYPSGLPFTLTEKDVGGIADACVKGIVKK